MKRNSKETLQKKEEDDDENIDNLEAEIK